MSIYSIILTEKLVFKIENIVYFAHQLTQLKILITKNNMIQLKVKKNPLPLVNKANKTYFCPTLVQSYVNVKHGQLTCGDSVRRRRCGVHLTFNPAACAEFAFESHCECMELCACD